MKKELLAVAVALMMTGSTWAATPDTVVGKTDAMETVVYGQVQQGAIIDRVNQLDETVYGTQGSGTLSQKVDSLYSSIEGGSNSNKATILQRLDVLEWTYNNKVNNGSLINRVEQLERSVYGRVTTGSLSSRISSLYKTIDGADVKLTPQIGTIAQNHVFAVTLDTPISSKTDKVGDPFTFTVAEDIMDGDVLLVPAGTQGTGKITMLKKAGIFGRNAKVDLSFDNIPTIDGSSFAAYQGDDAKQKTKSMLTAAGASVAGVALLGPVGLVGGLFVKGQSVELPVGTTVYVQPTETVTVQGIVVGGDGLNHANDMAVQPMADSLDNIVTAAPVAQSTAASDTDTSVDDSEVAGDTASASASDTPAADTSASSGDTGVAPSEPIVVVKRS